MQGLVLGFFSSAIAFGIQWYLYEKVTAWAQTVFPMITILSFEYLWYYILAAFLFIGLLVGFMGGVLSIACYMRESDRSRI